MSKISGCLGRARNRVRSTAAALALALTCGWAVAQAVANPFDYTRTSDFTYTAAGVLETETIELANSASCMTTRYSFDAWGNRSGATTANTGVSTRCTGVTGLAQADPRATTSTYGAQTATGLVAPAGTFPTQVINAKNQSETRLTDPRFGVVVSVTGPNAITTTWTVDAFGRVTLENRPDGTSVATLHCWLATAVPDTTANSAGCTAPGAGEVPAGAVRYEESELRRGATKIGAASRVYFDAAGRKLRTRTEAFDATTQVGGGGRFIAQDAIYNRFGAVEYATQPYFADTLASLAGTASTGSPQYGITRTDYDVLGRPVAVYTADPIVGGAAPAPAQTGGSQASVNFNGRVLRAARTTIEYLGQTVRTTDDRGRIKEEHRNPDGQVIASTDAYGAQIAHQLDAFGNLIWTKDPLGNVITATFDVRGRRLQVNDPNTGVTAWCYDGLGQVKAQQTSAMRGSHTAAACPTASGLGTTAPSAAGWTTMAYDTLGRMTQRIDANMPGATTGYTSTWTYDACTKGVGKVCTVATSQGVSRKYQYDSLGRATASRVDVTGTHTLSAISGVSYDINGRIDSQTLPTGLKLSFQYTAKGYLQTVRPGNSITVPTPAPVNPLTNAQALWTAKSYNAWNRAELSTYSSGVDNRAVFEALTGRVLQLNAGTGGGSGVMDQRYGWDSVNQFLARIDQLGDGTSGVPVQDSFVYDNLGRLKQYTVTGNSTPATRTVDLRYNAVGLLLYKSDVGSYTYPTQGVANGVPGGVHTISGAHSSTYTYDRNGNMATASGGKYRTLAFTSFDMPDSSTGIAGAAGSPRYTWLYDETHQRLKEVRVDASGTRVTWSLHPDNLGAMAFEREIAANGTQSNRHYITAGSSVIGVVVTTGALPALAALGTAGDMNLPVVTSHMANKLEYWHKDLLGSVVATTNQAGSVTQRLAYDPFGKRRQPNSAYDAAGAIVVDWNASGTPGTDRGFTGHEHLDDLGIVHMNGRVYDPLIARFMQADPLVQNALDLQSYDRYGYCSAAPMACTDPSGYFSLKKFVRVVAAIVIAVYAPQFLGEYMGWAWAATPVATSTGTTWALTWQGAAVTGFVSGAVASDSLKGGVQGAFSGLVFWGAGSIIETGLGSGAITNQAARAAIHGVAGCITSEAAGGQCKEGAISAAFSKAALPYTEGIPDPIVRGVLQAVIGGTAAELGGGSFANGAQTAAFAYLFNYLSHEARMRLVGAGAFLGGTAGAAVAGGCTAGTGGVCALGAPAIIGGGTALGAVTGEAIANAWDQLDNLLSKAMNAGPQAVQYALVAERSGLYPTVAGDLVQMNAGDVWKYGISTNPTGRYPSQALSTLGLVMEIQARGTLPQVYVAEKIQLINYAVTNGSLPPGNRIFK